MRSLRVLGVAKWLGHSSLIARQATATLQTTPALSNVAQTAVHARGTVQCSTKPHSLAKFRSGRVK